MFLSSRYKDDEKDMVILRSYEKEYKETRRIFDQKAAKIELVKEVILEVWRGRWKILLTTIDIKTRTFFSDTSESHWNLSWHDCSFGLF